MQTHAIRGQFGFHPVYSLFQRSWMAVSLSGWYCHDCDPILSPSHSSKFLFQTLHPFQDPALNYTLLHFVILFNPGDLLIIHKSVCPSFALGLAKQQSCFFNWITGLTAFNLLSHFSPLIRHKVKNVWVLPNEKLMLDSDTFFPLLELHLVTQPCHQPFLLRLPCWQQLFCQPQQRILMRSSNRSTPKHWNTLPYLCFLVPLAQHYASAPSKSMLLSVLSHMVPGQAQLEQGAWGSDAIVVWSSQHESLPE